jgi:hydrophobic/amphiphilic exporter-1 (mainly G- bacteria), HAE1 family
MVVDDAIVVLENISKHIERGSSPREAAIYATNEVWLAVIVTTLTVVAVFLPLTLVGGMTGVLFRQLGWVVSITVVTSTLAAITLTPMLSAQLLKLRPKNGKKPRLQPRQGTSIFELARPVLWTEP